MGFDYALVHVVYTIPPALLLTLILFPFLTRTDVYKVSFLITVAVVWTVPWDSYLISQSIWSYPPDSIIGPTFFRIPAEELFFFVIQTYFTSLLYILLNKSTLFPTYLGARASISRHRDSLRHAQRAGQSLIIGILLSQLATTRREGIYLKLIILWSAPVLLLLWTLAFQLLVRLPSTKVILPIALPTLYLWLVDTVALRKGTWAISPGTKWDFQPWSGMEIEEAVFFLLTNTLVVFGLVAFDNAIAVIDISPSLFPRVSALPSPTQLVTALLLPVEKYDEVHLHGLNSSLRLLQQQSRSFYLASSVFTGRLRIDLILLYAYCRVADDLIDNSRSPDEAKKWIDRLSTYLDVRYTPGQATQSNARNTARLLEQFPSSTRSILLQLPTARCTSSPSPLYDLLEGFRTDLKFSSTSFPIQSMSDLSSYSYHVASTVAVLCLDLIFHHYPPPKSDPSKNQECLNSAINMAKALQYINIARDVPIDARAGRCYLPTSLLHSHGTTPEHVLKTHGLHTPAISTVRHQILTDAMALYAENVDAIDHLPAEARGGIRLAVEAYVEIGRVMMKCGFDDDDDDDNVEYHDGKGRKATVSKWRRFVLAWKCMAGWT